MLLATAIAVCALSPVSAQQGPSPYPMPPEIPAPQDKPYPGTIKLTVDATDTTRAIFRVHENIPVAHAGAMVLLFPKWLPGNHGPTGPIDKLAGLTIRAGNAKIAWTRDVVDVYAFHVDVPASAKSLELDFQFVSPVETREGRVVMTPEMLNLQWNAMALYPAGFFSRQILFAPSVKLPADWKLGSALETASTAGGMTNFKPVPFNTLVDSPLFAGKYFARIDLDPGAKAAVHMDIVADRAEDLAITPAQLQAHRNLVQQAYKLFGSHHYDHYDFLFGLSEVMSGIGLEHHRSSEDGTGLKYFTDWDKSSASRDLLCHEYTHSWNGKFRRPADCGHPTSTCRCATACSGFMKARPNIGARPRGALRTLDASSRPRCARPPMPRFRQTRGHAVASAGGHHQRSDHRAKAAYSVAELAAQRGLLRPGRADLARRRYAHSPEDGRQEIAGRFRTRVFRYR